MKNKEIREKLEIGWDKVIIKGKDSRDGVIHKGDIYVDRGYFYRHGMTPEKLADRVLEIFPDAKIIDSGDHFGAWPNRSYMWVVFRLPKGGEMKKESSFKDLTEREVANLCAEEGKPQLEIIGKDGNVFNILGLAIRAGRKAGWSKERIEKFKKDAMSGDYNNVLNLCSENFDVC